jgi:hypothetical protein
MKTFLVVLVMLLVLPFVVNANPLICIDKTHTRMGMEIAPIEYDLVSLTLLNYPICAKYAHRQVLTCRDLFKVFECADKEAYNDSH